MTQFRSLTWEHLLVGDTWLEGGDEGGSGPRDAVPHPLATPTLAASPHHNTTHLPHTVTTTTPTPIPLPRPTTTKHTTSHIAATLYTPHQCKRHSHLAASPHHNTLLLNH